MPEFRETLIDKWECVEKVGACLKRLALTNVGAIQSSKRVMIDYEFWIKTRQERKEKGGTKEKKLLRCYRWRGLLYEVTLEIDTGEEFTLPFLRGTVTHPCWWEKALHGRMPASKCRRNNRIRKSPFSTLSEISQARISRWKTVGEQDILSMLRLVLFAKGKLNCRSGMIWWSWSYLCGQLASLIASSLPYVLMWLWHHHHPLWSIVA